MITYLMYTTRRRYNYEKIIYISATFFLFGTDFKYKYRSVAAVNQITNNTIGVKTGASASNSYSDPNTTINTQNTSINQKNPI